MMRSLPLLRAGRSCTSLLAAVALLTTGLWGRADEESARTAQQTAPAEDATTTRPQAPPSPPDPAELELRPDAEGKIRFSFQGQPWQGVLEWLGEISGLSLDWQEVPAGYLNLRTQQTYSIEEARDLINRHLLDRGFTLLRHGEILSVVNIRKLDPSLVPRLEPDELPAARPHDFVRVSFELEWITSETAVEDLRPLISPNGRLTAIKSTNRLEAIDAVANLQEIHKLLSDPQSGPGPRRKVREFRLQHVKAADVQQQLVKLLGLEKSSPASDPGALMQQMANFMKQAGVAPGQLANAKPSQPPPVHLVANVRDNSILAHAPADQMAIIAEAIQVMDNPQDKSRSVLRNSSRVQVYPLAVAEPDAVLKLLTDLADLSPETRLQVDRKKRAIVAHANLADHLTIRTLVEKLDGTVRSFRVIPLSQLDADYVAGSIDLVMGGGDATRRQAARDAEDEARRFRVVADVEQNRLLLWVNDDELADVQELLAELGESPVTLAARTADRNDAAAESEVRLAQFAVDPPRSPGRRAAQPPAPAEPRAEPRPAAPELPMTDYRVFRMQHQSTWAYSIAENLRQFFEERQKAEERQRAEQAATARWYDPQGARWIQSPRAEAERRRAIRPPPRFIVDSDTNSILAIGGDAEQLERAADLIALYDTAEARETHVTRVTRLVPVRHGQARQIAETVKEVYRDLFNSDGASVGGSRRRWQEPMYKVAVGGKPGAETLVRYKGQLSIGVDDGSSSVVVSAPEGLVESVEATIRALDEATLEVKPRVQVVRIRKGMDVHELQRRLMQAINKR